MKKIPKHLESPIDNLIYFTLIEKVAPTYHSLGFTPNMITTLGNIATGLSAYALYNEYFMKKFQDNYIKHTQFIQNNLDEKLDNITIEDGNHLSDESSSDESSSDESSLVSETSSNYSDDSSVISENSIKFDTILKVEKYNYS